MVIKTTTHTHNNKNNTEKTLKGKYKRYASL